MLIVIIEIFCNKCICKGKDLLYRNCKIVWKCIEDVLYGIKNVLYKSVLCIKNVFCCVRNVFYCVNCIVFEKCVRLFSCSVF